MSSSNSLSFSSRFSEIIALDYQSLALLRIGMGAIIIFDLIIRSTDLIAHYCDVGVMPRSVLFERYWRDGFFSFHTLSGEPLLQIILFFLAGIFAFFLLIGYRTRLATLVSWILLVSLHNRNPMILNGGDATFRLMLFWAMFLPIGARWSIDALKGHLPEKKYVSSAASFCLIMQAFLIYFFNYLTKSDPIWREQFNALYYALNVDPLTSNFGRLFLHNSPLLLLQFLTFATLILEGLFPLLLFSPFYIGLTRSIISLSFIFFHLGIILAMQVGEFPFVCIVLWIALLPPWFWEKISPTPFATSNQPSLNQPLKHSFIRKTLKLAISLFCLFTITYIMAWNIRYMNHKKYGSYFPKKYNTFAYRLRLDQYWVMFAPKPLRDDGWYVIPATLKDGSQYDLCAQSKNISYQKPKQLTSTFYYRNQRWRKFMRNLWRKKNAYHRQYFADYLCRKWNNQHKDNPEKMINNFTIFYMKEKTLPPDRKTFKVKKVDLYHHKCNSQHL